MSSEGLRKRLSGHVVNLGLRGVSRLASLHPRARPERYGVEVLRDVSYGPNGAANLLDVYVPRGPKLAPILYLHGGGFRILSKETHWGMALALAHRGHVVFVPNYRLAPRHPFPAGAEDACRAALWVSDHAASYGVDPEALVLAGESAGANLALVVAIARSWSRPEPWAQAIFERAPAISGLMPACGMLQVSEPEHRGTEEGFVLDRIRAIGEAYLPPGLDAQSRQLADVVSFLETAPAPTRSLPPVFAICGSVNPVRRDTERLTPAWRRHGAQASHSLYEGGIHAFHAFLWTRIARRAWADQHAFLESLRGS